MSASRTSKTRKRNSAAASAASPRPEWVAAAQALKAVHDGPLWRAHAALIEAGSLLRQIDPRDLPHRPIPGYRDLPALIKRIDEAYEATNTGSEMLREIARMHGLRGRI
jgi:hypothetical protein